MYAGQPYPKEWLAKENMNFSVVHAFCSTQATNAFWVVEVKWLNLPKNAPNDVKYTWVLANPPFETKLLTLQDSSMSTRDFAQGKLIFTSENKTTYNGIPMHRAGITNVVRKAIDKLIK